MKNFSEHPVWSTLEAEHKPSISLFEGPSGCADAKASLGYQIPTSRGLSSESGTVTRWKPTVPAAAVPEERMRTTRSEMVIFTWNLRFRGDPRGSGLGARTFQ
jgi:hypothetical protein